MITFNVLTDFSAASANAVAYAVGLTQDLTARQMKAEVRLLIVDSAPEHAADQSTTPQKGLSNLLDLVGALRSETPCSYAMLGDAPAETLTEQLQRPGQHLLVVGRGHPGGAVLELVRLVPVPLVIVPASYRTHRAPRRLVLDTDKQPVRLPTSVEGLPEFLADLCADKYVRYLQEGPEGAAELLRQIAPSALGIHVYTDSEPAPDPTDVLEKLDEIGCLAGFAHSVHTLFHESIEQGILQTAEEYHADMLLFVARQRSLPGTLFEESPTAKLMLHSPIPALVIPEAEPVLWLR